jgi:NADH-quinone oxidoreductase subunit C
MSDSLSAAQRIQNRFPEAVRELFTFREEVTLVIERPAIVEVAAFCRETDGLEFNMLADLAAVDYYPDEPRFAVSYVLYSFAQGHQIRLKVYAPGEDPLIPSVTGVWAGADWPEREVWDMFGIRFEGHPDLRRILMPFDWTGHPQRKDYPLGYEEVQFTFNYDRVQAKKPHPED